jgi:hypothetical protein
MRKLRLSFTFSLAGLVVLLSVPTYEDKERETDLEMILRVCMIMNLRPEDGPVEFFRSLDLELKSQAAQ